MMVGGLCTDTMSQRHSPTRLSTRPDDYRSTPAGLLGYLAVLAVALGLLTAPVVVGTSLAVAGLVAGAVHLVRASAGGLPGRPGSRPDNAAATDRAPSPDGRAAD